MNNSSCRKNSCFFRFVFKCTVPLRYFKLSLTLYVTTGLNKFRGYSQPSGNFVIKYQRIYVLVPLRNLFQDFRGWPSWEIPQRVLATFENNQFFKMVENTLLLCARWCWISSRMVLEDMGSFQDGSTLANIKATFLQGWKLLSTA